MRLGRTLAPSAAPVGIRDLAFSVADALAPAQSEARLKEELRAFLGAEAVFFVSSGKAALTVVLEAMSTLRPGLRRVVIPAYTCYSVPSAVIRAGLEPVLVDLDPDTLDFEEASLCRALAHPDVLCVIPTHLLGVPSNVDRIKELVDPQGVFVLEDAAQAFGLTTADGRRLGSMGDAGVFSFGRGKHLTCGSGGLIATRTPEITQACRSYCASLPKPSLLRTIRTWVELAAMSALINPHLYWIPNGLPFLGLGETVYEEDFAMTRLPVTAMGALRQWRTRLADANAEREAAVEGWSRALGVALPTSRKRPLLRLPVLLQSEGHRDALVNSGRRRGLGVSRMYPHPVHRIPELGRLFAGQRFPGAEAIAARLATLPTHEYVRESDRARLAEVWPETLSRPSRSGACPVAHIC